MPKHRLNTLDYPPAARPDVIAQHRHGVPAYAPPYSPLSAPWTPAPVDPVHSPARPSKWRSVAAVVVRAMSMGR